MKKHIIALTVIAVSFFLLFWLIDDTDFRKTQLFAEKNGIFSVKTEKALTTVTLAGQSVTIPEEIVDTVSFTIREGTGLYTSLIPDSVTVPIRQYGRIWTELSKKMQVLLLPKEAEE